MKVLAQLRALTGASLLALVANTAVAAPPSWVGDYGTRLNEYDDDSRLVELPFPVSFYGNTYTTLYANSNGNITFNGYNYDYWHTNIPDDSVYSWGYEYTFNNVIAAPLYADWTPTGAYAASGWYDTPLNVASDVYVNTVGQAPHRQFVVTWVQIPQFCTWSDGGDTVCWSDPAATPNNFQVQLFEGSGQIQFGYNGLTTNGINWTDIDRDGVGDPMSVGISSGTGAFIRSALGAEITALDNTNICYSPSGAGYMVTNSPCDVVIVSVDVQPGRRANYFPVAQRKDFVFVVLGSSAFNATRVEAQTVRIGDARGGAAVGLLGFKYTDMNNDGIVDFAAKVSGGALVDSGAIRVGTSELSVTGTTFEGVDFAGTDAIAVQ